MVNGGYNEKKDLGLIRALIVFLKQLRQSASEEFWGLDFERILKVIPLKTFGAASNRRLPCVNIDLIT
jgi:hypothetical protein